ncbi:helix-turn-helix domain-containing protein, partial [Steroidobacter sp.]|uniref:helix-turn-helix domain-containing protein n=1 Tax=Steroidobacter sp. TaxID=1978227 RepID=UPI001A54DF9B
MNAADSSDSPAVDTAPVSSAELNESLTPGELLRRERERREITKLHIAEELHLDVRVVDAIEANRFDELGVPVYARGHLRQYAALLGLSPQFIIQRYEAVTGQQDVALPMPTSASVGSSIGMERPSLAGPLWSGVGLIALLMGWWLWSTVSEPGDPMLSVTPDAAVEAELGGETSPAPTSTTASTPTFVDTPEPVASAQ